MPSEIWEDIFSRAPHFPTKAIKNGKVEELPVFNLTNVPPCEYPIMALRLGEQEWLAEMSNPSLNVASLFDYDGATSALLSSEGII